MNDERLEPGEWDDLVGEAYGWLRTVEPTHLTDGQRGTE